MPVLLLSAHRHCDRHLRYGSVTDTQQPLEFTDIDSIAVKEVLLLSPTKKHFKNHHARHPKVQKGHKKNWLNNIIKCTSTTTDQLHAAENRQGSGRLKMAPL